MDKKHKDILIERRVELVETLDVTGGLYTQLLSRKVLNQRKVNEIKLQRSPEAQAEELLSHLPKKDCFDAFCEALIADDQEHIVDKILKPAGSSTTVNTPSIPPTSSSIPESSQAATTPLAPLINPQGNPSSNEAASTEDTDSANGLKRLRCPSPPQAVVCIKEADEKYLYIQYSNPASPAKRQRAVMKSSENKMVEYETDETRYAMKHFVTDKDNVDTNDLALVQHPSSISDHPNQYVVLQNPQSLRNPNISDHARYNSAFLRQQLAPEKPYENSPPSILSHHHQHLESPVSNSYKSSPLSSNEIQPARHDNQMTKGWQQVTITPDRSSQNAQFVSLGSGMGSLTNSPNKLFGSNLNSHSNEFHYVDDPVKLLQQTGVLNSAKGASSVTTPPHFSLNSKCPQAAPLMADSVDCAAGVTVSASPIKSFTLPTPFPSVTHSPSKLNLPKVPDNNLDLEIDLPDGCVNVQVEHSTKQFFLNNFKKSYPMRQIPRGLALVMNVDEVKGKPPRKGTNFDRDNLCNLLSQLHFNCLVYNDADGLSAQEMVNKLKNFAKLKDHYNYDACFICLLSHGEEGYIFGTDGKRIPLEEIFMLFGNTSCKGLIGKPKVFIIQACRGGTLDKGVRMDEPDGGTIPSPAPTVQQLPSLSDMLICYPTQMGYYAWRNRARGSWYIEAIVQVFMRYAKCEDICAMLNRVNQVVSRKVSECNLKEMNQMSQMSEYKSTLRQPHLFLFPGIGCSNQ